MAESNLQLCIQSYIIRRNEINNLLSDLADQKMLISYQQLRNTTKANAAKSALRQQWSEKWNEQFDRASDQDAFMEKYGDYSAMEGYKTSLESLNAELAKLEEELTAKENHIDNQVTTNSTELTEVNAYMESYKSMLKSNIGNDFKYGLS
ncbi:hypothetical protein IJI31_00560 [bacterium]|nr:hypothetical protein [bacterium]